VSQAPRHHLCRCPYSQTFGRTCKVDYDYDHRLSQLPRSSSGCGCLPLVSWCLVERLTRDRAMGNMANMSITKEEKKIVTYDYPLAYLNQVAKYRESTGVQGKFRFSFVGGQIAVRDQNASLWVLPGARRWAVSDLPQKVSDIDIRARYRIYCSSSWINIPTFSMSTSLTRAMLFQTPATLLRSHLSRQCPRAHSERRWRMSR
jgi:hypothetical protein